MPESAPPELVHLTRWFLALPEPLPLPSGYTVTERIGNTFGYYGTDEDPMVTVIVHQVTTEFGRTLGAATAVSAATKSAPGLPQPDVDQAGDAHFALATDYTVIEAITVEESPDGPPNGWSGRPQDLPPRSDALMRCIRLVTDLVRAYRIASEVPYALPSYERIPSPVLVYVADAVREWHADGPHPGEHIRSIGGWGGPQVMMLDHLNTLDSPSGPSVEGVLEEKFNEWMHKLRTGSPFIAWRDRFADAKRALLINGDYPQAVVLAATSSEVFLDALLSLLMWEERVDAAAAAERFEEGKIVKRVATEFPPRLLGNWHATGQGPVGEWFRSTYRLRHRVVHGGYDASRSEAEAAVEASHRLEKFAFDRLAARSSAYPRATLMSLAQPGLARRGAWNQRIKKFSEEVAPIEDNWAQSFAAYRQELVAARLAAIGAP